MEKFRITDMGTLEIRMFKDRVQFSTTPDYQEVIAELSKENALKIADKLRGWAETIHDAPASGLSKHVINCKNYETRM